MTMMATVEKVFSLKGVGIFSELAGELLAEIAVIAEEVDRAPGAEIIREGDVDDSLFVLLDGNVSVSRGGQKLAELGKGEVFGELALLDPAPRNATVTALTDVTLLRIDAQPFCDLMDENPGIARAILRVVTRRLRAAGGG
jgi:CRP-like cAMP-binding protein